MSHLLTATLEFWHKEWLFRLETLQTFDQTDVQTKKHKEKYKRTKRQNYKIRNTKLQKCKKEEEEKRQTTRKRVYYCDVRELSHFCNVLSSSSKWLILTERSIEHLDMNLSMQMAAPLLLILLLIPTTSPLSPLYSLTHSCTHCNNILTLLVSASFSDVSTSTSHSHRSGILGQASDNHLQWVSSFPSKSTSISPKGHQSINQTYKGPLLTLIPWLGSSICYKKLFLPKPYFSKLYFPTPYVPKPHFWSCISWNCISWNRMITK